MTTALVALCSLVYVVLWAVALAAAEDRGAFAWQSLYALPNEHDLLQRFGALELTRVWLDREWWRLLTTPLVHGSWLHLVLNMIALASVGSWVEHVWGKYCTFVLFLLSALAGCLLSLLWAEAAIVVGASGGIMGLAGALWLARWRGPPRLREQLELISARQLGIMLGLVLAIGAFVPMIAQAGHIGGLLLGLWVAGARVRGFPRAGWISAFVLLGALVPPANAPTWRANYHEFIGFRWLDEGRNDDALRAFSRAFELAPGDPGMANAIAYELALQGQELDRALELVESALSMEPTNPDFLDTKGWILCRQGHVQDGEAWLHKAVAAAKAASQKPNDEILEHVETCATALPPPGR